MAEANQDFKYLINGKSATVNDPTPTSAQILADAGYEPADDYLLIQRTKFGSRVVASDDVLNVGDGHAEFFAFEGGEAFEFTVNEHSVFWGEQTIRVDQIRSLANVSEDNDLVWIRDEAGNEVLKSSDVFQLGKQGIEHLRTHKRPPPSLYIFFVDGVEYKTEHERLTGAQITAMIPGWDPTNSLVLEGEGSEPDEVIHPATVVEFKGRATPAHFAIVPPATFGDA
ncbi:TPA: multiubiquitin domain-containing protein [Burkholderia aenigmatica]|uniref:multiubiquitin domain-containing protein n=1 Tax=Burkholderia sp. AU45251 TaxID=3059204 RepID=UPI0026565CF8|nr:multiubiquitin domain-containing protein [Burkholderia sp. AU45251]HDR9486426.1 multiubiquitin domain-containing protein [Burkholderia aenigmatica]MDN7519911.1 multiubiquitin domain-containing protein [Burkholderia sp. AU45251]HDR9517075.1 multiubiquitin domain-containing protein [Burkholderia aenigmatica]HDR9594846.1 multiubiquitin domain-containing protein [Burkholderia aenigmatica]HDR9600169.1 multiubiquitin domain-containing protein [Burkholderia aenigmatica]